MWRYNGVSMPGFAMAVVIGIAFFLIRPGLERWLGPGWGGTPIMVFFGVWIGIDGLCLVSIARQKK